MIHRLRLALPLALVVLLADCTTKTIAVERLSPEHEPHAVVGDVVRFTLAYNPGAALSLPVGDHARWPLTILGSLLLVGIMRVLWVTAPNATARRVALGLIMGGALGNLLNRMIMERGVVDFIDIGIGTVRFWVFNIADVGVMTGAVLLAWTVWRDEKAEVAEVTEVTEGRR